MKFSNRHSGSVTAESCDHAADESKISEGFPMHAIFVQVIVLSRFY